MNTIYTIKGIQFSYNVHKKFDVKELIKNNTPIYDMNYLCNYDLTINRKTMIMLFELPYSKSFEKVFARTLKDAKLIIEQPILDIIWNATIMNYTGVTIDSNVQDYFKNNGTTSAHTMAANLKPCLEITPFSTITKRYITKADNLKKYKLGKYSPKNVIKAQDDRLLAVFDYNALEPRILMNFAGIKCNDSDIYTPMADELKTTRDIVKIIILSLMYGMGNKAMISKYPKIFNSIDDVKKFKDMFKEKYTGIFDWMDRLNKVWNGLTTCSDIQLKGILFENDMEYNIITLPTGIKLRIKKSTPQYKLINYIIQGTASTYVALKVSVLKQKGFNVLFHVHDSIVVEIADNKKTDEVYNKIKEIIESPFIFINNVTLPVKGTIDRHYK